MKKLFGQYLIENELISSSELLTCLIDQVDRLPSLLKIVFENNLLSGEQIFEALAFQHQSQTDFKSALKHLSYWNSEINAKVNMVINKHKVPVGKILVEKEIMSQDDLVGHLDKFLDEFAKSNVEHDPSTVEVKDNSIVDAPVSVEHKGSASSKSALSSEVPETPGDSIEESKENVISLDQKTKKSLDFEPSFEIIDEGMVQDYIELLNEDRKTDVDNMILDWEKLDISGDGKEKLTQDFRDLYRELHTYKGSACFIKAHLTEKIIHLAEEVLNKYQTFVDQVDSIDVDLLTSCLLQVLDIVWELKYTIMKTSSEEFIWRTAPFKNKYTEVYGGLKERLAAFENMSVDLDNVGDAF